jgi:hypothetical protein
VNRPAALPWLNSPAMALARREIADALGLDQKTICNDLKDEEKFLIFFRVMLCRSRQ